MEDQWWCVVVGQEVGPLSWPEVLAMLGRGQIDLEDRVRAGTSGHWQPLRDVLAGVPAPADSEPPAASMWYCRILGDEHGPYRFDELKEYASQGQLSPKHDVREGTEGPWIKAGSVAGLFEAAAVATASDDDFLNDVSTFLDERPAKRAASRRSSDDLLAGMADLEDAEPAFPRRSPGRPPGRSGGRSSDDLLAGLDELEDAETPPATPVRKGGTPRNIDPPPRSELRDQPSSGQPPRNLRPGAGAAGAAAAHRDGDRTSPVSAARNSAPPPVRSEAVREDARNVPRAEATPERKPVSVGMSSPAPPAEPARVEAPAPRFTPPPPTKPAYSPARSSSSGGGMSFDFSSLSVKHLAIGGGIIALLAAGYFGLGSGLLSSFNAGGVYDETVKLHQEFQTVMKSDPNSAEFTAFYDKFKIRQQELLKELGTPSLGSKADEVRRAVLSFRTVVEAHRRPDIKPADRKPWIDALDQQLGKLKQEFGR